MTCPIAFLPPQADAVHFGQGLMFLVRQSSLTDFNGPQTTEKGMHASLFPVCG
jgi:hypothetical protein